MPSLSTAMIERRFYEAYDEEGKRVGGIRFISTSLFDALSKL